MDHTVWAIDMSFQIKGVLNISATGFQSRHKYECSTLKNPDPTPSDVALIYGPLMK